MGIEVTQELFQRHDPLAFDDEKVAMLAEKHGIRPHFCNTKWRDDRKGWGSLDPIEKDDPRFKDVYDCLRNKPRRPERRMKDGMYQQGDLVLSVQTCEDWEIAQLRRDYLANRRARNLADGNPVADQLALEMDTKNVEAYDPEITHRDDHGRDMIEAARNVPSPGQAARGFVMPKPSSQTPAMGAGLKERTPTTRKSTRKRTTRSKK